MGSLKILGGTTKPKAENEFHKFDYAVDAYWLVENDVRMESQSEYSGYLFLHLMLYQMCIDQYYSQQQFCFDVLCIYTC